MASKIRISLAIGAFVGSSVNAAFATVNDKIQSMRKAYNTASHQASVLGAAIKAEEALNAARKNASANDNDSKSLKALRKAEAAYEKARKAALGYGDSIDVWSRKHSEAARTTEELNARLERLQSLQNVRSGIEANASRVRAAFTDLAGTVMQGTALVKPVKIGMGFEEGMSKVQAISSSTEDDLQKLTAQARLLGATTVWSAKEASEGMSFLAMADFKTNQIHMLESMRLVDVEGMSHERAAQSMGISSPTLCRILAKGRRLTAQALSGAIINIEGGNIMCSTQQDKPHRFCHRHGEMHGEHGSHGNGMAQKRCGKGKCEKNEANQFSSESDC